MENFGHFAAGFSDMKEDNDLDIAFNDSRGYFWRIGTPAKEYWQPDFEDKVADAKPIEISTFRAMFEEGGELLGIPVAKDLGDFRGARLYRMSEYNKSFPVNNMLVSYNGVILPADIPRIVNDPLTNEMFNTPIVIKPETLTMNGPFDAVDVIASKTSGLVYGVGLRNQVRATNRLNGESLMGTFDYKTGNIQLIRSSDNNDSLLPQYAAFVDAFATDPATAIPPSGTLTNISFTLNYKTFANPVSVVWEFLLD